MKKDAERINFYDLTREQLRLASDVVFSDENRNLEDNQSLLDLVARVGNIMDGMFVGQVADDEYENGGIWVAIATYNAIKIALIEHKLMLEEQKIDQSLNGEDSMAFMLPGRVKV